MRPACQITVLDEIFHLVDELERKHMALRLTLRNIDVKRNIGRPYPSLVRMNKNPY